ncbi:MAG TPA: GNAT family N-acetyltransferase [Thermoanaerobaculia bacterium]|nr:GNAT family N-acetyltransferase [Thermoanaerobaculia bacterium]
MIDPAELEANELEFLRRHRSAVAELGFGTLYVSSDPDALSWNFLTNVNASDGQLDLAGAIFRDWHRRPCIKVTPSSKPADLATRLESRGWRVGLSLTHMVFDGRDGRRSADITVRLCRTDEDIAIFSDVQSRGFGAPEWVHWVHKINLINSRDPDQHFYLAERNGRPAGVCLLLTASLVGGLYAVATLPEERGHGVAAALLARAIEHSVHSGNRVTVLNTATGGDAERVFVRLGFQAVFDSRFYTPAS